MGAGRLLKNSYAVSGAQRISIGLSRHIVSEVRRAEPAASANRSRRLASASFPQALEDVGNIIPAVYRRSTSALAATWVSTRTGR
jgi:hypothetical protein